MLTERLSGSPRVIVLLKLDFPSVPSTPPTDDVLVVTSYFVAMSVPFGLSDVIGLVGTVLFILEKVLVDYIKAP